MFLSGIITIDPGMIMF